MSGKTAAPSGTVGYAVVGLGWIAQAAMLPAFRNAGRNSRLTALVSGDPEKRRVLAARYGLPDSATYDYDDFEACLDRRDVNAVYIAVPNHLHREYAVRAARKGAHVLCEKPMAVTAEECEDMITACRSADVRLMIAYRLHLDPANLRAVELVEADAVGPARLFAATFTQQVQEGDVRLMASAQGGGPLYDIGIYCINAARYLLRAEPESVWATAVTRPQDRFAETEEAVSCVLRFPGDRLATFTCSFGAHPVSVCRLVGDTGELAITNAFTFQGERAVVCRAADGEERHRIPDADQFGPMLLYFSDCILEGRAPEPDGQEGRVDVRIIEALYESLETGRAVSVDVARERRPTPDMALSCPPVEEPDMVRASEPSGDGS